MGILRTQLIGPAWNVVPNARNASGLLRTVSVVPQDTFTIMGCKNALLSVLLGRIIRRLRGNAGSVNFPARLVYRLRLALPVTSWVKYQRTRLLPVSTCPSFCTWVSAYPNAHKTSSKSKSIQAALHAQNASSPARSVRYQAPTAPNAESPPLMLSSQAMHRTHLHWNVEQSVQKGIMPRATSVNCVNSLAKSVPQSVTVLNAWVDGICWRESACKCVLIISIPPSSTTLLSVMSVGTSASNVRELPLIAHNAVRIIIYYLDQSASKTVLSSFIHLPKTWTAFPAKLPVSTATPTYTARAVGADTWFRKPNASSPVILSTTFSPSLPQYAHCANRPAKSANHCISAYLVCRAFITWTGTWVA